MSGGSLGPYSARERKVMRTIRSAYDVLSLPALVVFLLSSRRIDPAYRMSWRRRARLVWRMYRNTTAIETGTSLRAHVAMAAAVLEVPASVQGVLVECGCWRGGTSANLSLVAAATGRTLIVYDSFEGLPPPTKGDRWAHSLGTGAYRGDLETVRENIAAHGVIDVCELRKGWFADTLPHHSEPIVACYLDVDYQQSLHECVLHLWPHVTDSGYVFIDEYTRLDYCALFFSERWWRTYFDRPPPGLMGAGTGVGVGHYFLGPNRGLPPIQEARSVGYARKDFYGMWDHYPDPEPQARSGGGAGDSAGSEGWTLTDVSVRERQARRRKRGEVPPVAQ
jgi:hypothetical protein